MKQYTIGLSALALTLALVGGGCSPSSDKSAYNTGVADEGGAMMEDSGEMVSIGACPAVTSITAVENSLESFAVAGPFDWTSFTDAKASYDTIDKNNLKVYIANKDFPIGTLRSAVVSPVRDEAQGTGVLSLTFYGGDKKASPAVYDPTKKYGEMGLVSGEFRVPNDSGTGSDLSFYFTGGSATIVEVKDGKVCGTLDLSGDKQKLAGTFVATLE